ncbi:MAG TPA: hypothetical protein VK466_01250, partial [Terriglobales bacterium]|nr:hypothetical protein [Terriglobales bacterium]
MSLRTYGETPVRDYVLLVLAFISMLSCNSSRSKTLDPAPGPQQKGAGTVKESTGPDIDLNCVIDHIQNPSESFHYA